MAAVVYRCALPGPQILTASVTDDNRRRPCADVVKIAVTCKSKTSR